MFCKYCGQKNQEHAKFCQNCGGKLEEQITPSPAVNQTTPAATVSIPQKNDNKLILIIAVIIGICAIALPIIFMNKNNSEEKNDNKKEDTQVDNPTTPDIDTSVNNDKVQYGGYSFDIPYEYNKMEYDGNLAVYPNDSSWMMMFMFSESSFYELKNNTSLFDAMMICK